MAGFVAVATDVGAWRILEPVLRELSRRGVPYQAMLAEPCASIARQDGVEHVPLTAPTVVEQARTVLTAEPSALLLGTSVRAVVERELTRCARGRTPTLAVLDAMLFVERRFGAGLTHMTDLADVIACPDDATAERLRLAGAEPDRLVVTGNPTLEEIGLRRSPPAGPVRPTTGTGAGDPTDVLFVSSPVSRMRVHDAVFEIDEREALTDLLAALAEMPHLAPHGYRVRVRLHPVQRSEGLPVPPAGIALEPDDDPDRLASCAAARVVVGLSSTLLGEARFLPRAAIAYLPGEFWERERVFAPEYGVRLARSRGQLRALLAEAISQPPPPAPLAGHIGAAGRIADLILALDPR